MKTILINEDPYGELICSHVNKEFPHVAHLTQCEIVEALSNLIVGTKEVRYGSLPAPEHLVVIRDVIRTAIKEQKPIPILIPWGSIKANFTPTLDIAEVSAIQRLVHLSEEVSTYYSPGVEMVIRVEDTSGYTLFVLEGNNDLINRSIDLYSRDMKTLVSILSERGEIRVELESEMPTAPMFNERFEENSILIEQYLLDSWNIIEFSPEKVEELESYKVLRARQWRGIISYEQRMHYISAYQRLYQDWDLKLCIKRLSLYFGGAWTRHQLGMTGKQAYWNKFIQLAFIPPIKGLPEGYNSNYVYYRTLPLSEARTHIPSWRAKGYLRINGNNIQHKLTNCSDPIVKELIPMKLRITDDERNLSVIINADYLLES